MKGMLVKMFFRGRFSKVGEFEVFVFGILFVIYKIIMCNC